MHLKNFYKRISRKKRGWGRQSLYMLVIVVTVAPASHYVLNRFSIGIDPQNYPCLPEHRIYLIDKMDKDIQKGKIFAFRSEYISSIAIKFIDGVAGDKVRVNPEETTVNDLMVGEGLLLARESGHTEQELQREGIIPAGHIWLMGRTKVSFDSRFWGVLPIENVIGRAYPIW
ncbi:signal peptidase I [Klebsiella pneumoniae]|uniref:signal peptidase I n=1 Tax=Klebsiella pneumoniae TaxID=573 RepID=UPI0039B59A3F